MTYRQKLETSYGEEDLLREKKKSTSDLGIDGKFQWPIRIFTPLLFVSTLLTNYLLGFNRNG